MKLRSVQGKLYGMAVVVLFSLLLTVAAAWAGSMRINMKDGTFVDVPYYWEENDELRFEIAGGEAGVPKSQVTSVQEIVASKEFDPEALLETPKTESQINQDKALQEIINAKNPSETKGEKLPPEESLRLLKMAGGDARGNARSNERIHGPVYTIEGDFAELVKKDGNNLTLVIRYIVSSRTSLQGHAINLILYDSEGSVLQTKPCEIQELDIDSKTKKALGLQGSLYSVMASIKPETKIKRYEISSLQR